MGRVWAFARRGSPEHEEYLKSRRDFAPAALKEMGGRPSDRKVGGFVSTLLAKTVSFSGRMPEKEKLKAARAVLEHFSPTDTLIKKQSLDFAARNASRIPGLAQAERPLAALFVARAHNGIKQNPGHRDEVEALWRGLDKMRAEAVPHRAALKRVYDLALGHRVGASSRNIESEERRRAEAVRLKEAGANVLTPRQLGIMKTLVFALADVPEALWLGERKLRRR